MNQKNRKRKNGYRYYLTRWHDSGRSTWYIWLQILRITKYYTQWMSRRLMRMNRYTTESSNWTEHIPHQSKRMKPQPLWMRCIQPSIQGQCLNRESWDPDRYRWKKYSECNQWWNICHTSKFDRITSLSTQSHNHSYRWELQESNKILQSHHITKISHAI